VDVSPLVLKCEPFVLAVAVAVTASPVIMPAARSTC